MHTWWHSYFGSNAGCSQTRLGPRLHTDVATSHRNKIRPAASQPTSLVAQAVQGQALPVASAAPASAPPTVKLDATPTGPAQHGRGCNGQYVYWVCQPHLKAETVQRLKLKQPTAFTREQFAELMVRAHAALTTTIVETASFMELHVSGEYHHNCLVRADRQYRWKDILIPDHYKNTHIVNISDYKTSEILLFSLRVVVRVTATTRTMTDQICKKNIWICMISNTKIICAHYKTRNNEWLHPHGFSLQNQGNLAFFTLGSCSGHCCCFLKRIDFFIQIFKKDQQWPEQWPGAKSEYFICFIMKKVRAHE